MCCYIKTQIGARIALFLLLQTVIEKILLLNTVQLLKYNY